MSIVKLEPPVFDAPLKKFDGGEKKKKKKKKQTTQQSDKPIPPPVQPDERRRGGEEMPPRRFSTNSSKRTYLQNIDKEEPNGLPRQIAPSVSELRDQIIYRDSKGRRYAYVSEREYAYLGGTINAIVRASAGEEEQSVFAWVILSKSSSSSWPSINEVLQLSSTRPVIVIQQQPKGDDATENKTEKKKTLTFEARVAAIASRGPAQQWHKRKTSWVVFVPTSSSPSSSMALHPSPPPGQLASSSATKKQVDNKMMMHE